MYITPKVKTNDSQEFMYIALSLLSSRYDKSVLPEILFLLSSEQFIDLVKVFGGKSVRFPTPLELSKELLSSVAAYHRKVHGYSWSKIGKIMDLDGRTLRGIKNRVQRWEDWLEEEKMDLPDLLNRDKSNENNR